MKVNPVMLAVTIGIAALVAFGFFAGNQGESYRWLITAGSAVAVLLTAGGLLALSPEGGGSTVNIKAASALFFILLLVEHLIFSFTAVKLAPYVVITGILLLLYIIVCYAVSKAL
jgi:hypothetical protein